MDYIQLILNIVAPFCKKKSVSVHFYNKRLASIKSKATIGPPAKRQSNGVSLAGR